MENVVAPKRESLPTADEMRCVNAVVLKKGDSVSNSEPYQLMPTPSDDEFQILQSGIRHWGVLVPLKLDEVENIHDGHHRWRATHEWLAAGIRLRAVIKAEWRLLQGRCTSVNE